MKKKALWVMACLMASTLVLVACRNDNGDIGHDVAQENNEGISDESSPFAAYGLDADMRFTQPRTITVALWNRADADQPDFDESYWARWVQDQMLAEHNVIVEWMPIPRWDEGEFQSTQLAAQTAPDIGYTFDNSIVTTMAEMGGIHNMHTLLEGYGHLLPNLYDRLEEDFIYWNFDPTTQELWSITGRRMQYGGTVTFIREDWLDALDLPVPTTLEEFEETLLAFRDNAPDLVANPNQIIPYFITEDVGWDAMALFDSFISNEVTEREWFVYGFDDRRFHFEDAMREGSRVLNHWYHEGLLWDDFAIAEPSDGHDLIRLGYVGAFHSNWDMPFRAGGDAWITTMRESVGEDANFIPINPFQNDAGVARKFKSNPTDRFIFFPTTNDEELASLLYLDFMSRPETLTFLQFGFEGVHHEMLEDGTMEMLDSTNWPDNQHFGGLRNFDMTLTVNDIWFAPEDPERAGLTLGLGYPGIEPEIVLAALEMGQDNSYVFRNAQARIRGIRAEEGMSVPLSDQRDAMLARVIATVPVGEFDIAWEAEYQAYLELGAATIITEREQAWLEAFGDVDSMPE